MTHPIDKEKSNYNYLLWQQEDNRELIVLAFSPDFRIFFFSFINKYYLLRELPSTQSTGTLED